MDQIERLSAIFEKFPGIGPRQAQRFVQFLLRSSPSARRDLIDAIQALGSGVKQCPECMRFHAGSGKICSICGNSGRDARFLALVANDTDLTALESSDTYHGYYFVLGGTVSLTNEKSGGVRIPQLKHALMERKTKGLEEIILAFPANPEGEATAIRMREEVLAIAPEMKTTALGRGLSTGSELEYADAETIKSALESRR